MSAGFFDWMTGDVQKTTTRAGEGGQLATSIFKGGDSNTFSRTSKTGTSSPKSTARKSQAPDCPRGWETLLAKEGGGNCCRKAENTGRTLFSRK